MEYRRIQKLLSSEYCDFSDTVIIESPFAETTRDGRGLRQVALGLTSTRLVIAADILKKNSEFTCPPGLDPSIETFELVSVYPLDFIALSVFCRRKRKTIKARLIDGRAKYYELGGMECRNVLWALWCQSVREITAKRQDGSSLSETTAASSSSASTLYLLSSGLDTKKKTKNTKILTKYQIRTNNGAGDGHPWIRKDVYLGPSYNELSHGFYTPVPIKFAGASLEDLNNEFKNSSRSRKIYCKKTCSSSPYRKNEKSEKEFRLGAMCDVLFMRENRNTDRIFPREKNKRKQRYEKNDNKESSCEELRNFRIDRQTTSETSGISAAMRNCSRQKRKSGSPKKHSLVPKLSRFGFGVLENCNSGLYLDPWIGDRDQFRRRSSNCVDYCALIESGVRIWENYKFLKDYIHEKMNKNDQKSLKIDQKSLKTDKRKNEKNIGLKNLSKKFECEFFENPETRNAKKLKHPRRYGLATAAHFLHALGPWSVQPGERESVQRRRASSAVCIRRQPIEPELRLPVSKRQLAASVSMSSLNPGTTGTLSSTTRGRVVLFWTPEYWYRPRAAAAAYREVRRHLNSLQRYRTTKCEKKTFFRRRSNADFENRLRDSRTNLRGEKTSSTILGRIFSREKKIKDDKESGTSQLKRLLRMDLRITAWDLDSTTIARQLTLIDRELFLRIPSSEIEILITQKSSRNTPNLGAWIAFAHRISCLTASEILATKKLGMRTRMLARFINAADKCCIIGNFQSSRSILAGLQSPPIYRLKSTWSYLRTNHSTRYETMERLCKIFRNTETKSYRRSWRRCEKRPPLLPYVGDLLARILDEDDRIEKIESHFGKWKNLPGAYNYSKNIQISSLRSDRESKYKLKMESPGKRKESNLEKKIGGRFLSVMSKIGCSRPENSKIDSKPEIDPREIFLGRKYLSKWRRIALTSKLLAEKEFKLREMDPKRRKIMKICSWLCECQRHSQNYHFSGHSLAWEFLLKARYREDRENFFISLKLEPPCR